MVTIELPAWLFALWAAFLLIDVPLRVYEQVLKRKIQKLRDAAGGGE